METNITLTRADMQYLEDMILHEMNAQKYSITKQALLELYIKFQDKRLALERPGEKMFEFTFKDNNK